MKTRRSLTPIEKAMDAAMGFQSDGTAPVTITLRCPDCGKSQQAPAEETDPEGTAVVQTPCSDCFDRETAETTYWDRDNKQITD